MTVGALQKHKISTIADLERLSHEGLRYELLSGELKAMSPINMAHGDVTNCVADYVMSFAIEHDLGRGFVGDLGVTISRDLDTVLAADWAFYLKERLPNPYSTGYTTVMPDIVLETRSPGDSKREIKREITRKGADVAGSGCKARVDCRSKGENADGLSSEHNTSNAHRE